VGTWTLFAKECWTCSRKLPIPRPGEPGRNRRFCSAACKQRWYRARVRGRVARPDTVTLLGDNVTEPEQSVE